MNSFPWNRPHFPSENSCYLQSCGATEVPVGTSFRPALRHTECGTGQDHWELFLPVVYIAARGFVCESCQAERESPGQSRLSVRFTTTVRCPPQWGRTIQFWWATRSNSNCLRPLGELWDCPACQVTLSIERFSFINWETLTIHEGTGQSNGFHKVLSFILSFVDSLHHLPFLSPVPFSAPNSCLNLKNLQYSSPTYVSVRSIFSLLLKASFLCPLLRGPFWFHGLHRSSRLNR